MASGPAQSSTAPPAPQHRNPAFGVQRPEDKQMHDSARQRFARMTYRNDLASDWEALEESYETMYGINHPVPANVQQVVIGVHGKQLHSKYL